jgi:hypothetical protein
MTMKMISSTSITSTMGVTLMLELTFLLSSRTAIDIACAPLPENFYSGRLPALLGNRLDDARQKPAGGREVEFSRPRSLSLTP